MAVMIIRRMVFVCEKVRHSEYEAVYECRLPDIELG